ncbi:amidase [Peiella sedimenti]
MHLRHRLTAAAAPWAALFLLSGCISVEVTAPISATVEGVRAVPVTAVERDIDALRAGQAEGGLSAAAILDQAMGRFEAVDERGPRINSVLALNPNAELEAARLDSAREAGRALGPLHGVPILIKDNIETSDQPTTAGSLALIDNRTERDAPLVARLRQAGAVIFGKANLSEWANIRSSHSISGWSAVGGLTRNPYALERTACGSSSGSGAAVAAGIVPVAIGTETDGSITCPAAVNGVVGLKPTVGLVSRTHIVPISHSQDTAGPMTRTVRDAAIVLNAIAGSDPADPATAEADRRRTDYVAALDPHALRGARIGVMRFATGYSQGTDAAFEQALADLRAQGAVLVDITEGPDQSIGRDEFQVLLYELKADLAAYLAATDPVEVPTRTLADVIAFNARTPAELALFDQDIFEAAQAKGPLTDAAYREARERSFRLAGPEGIDRMLRDNDVIALVAPTTGPGWVIDLVNGDNHAGSASRLAAVSGYPHLTVPMGQVRGLPVGLSFIGPAWSEARLLALGYAYEQATHRRRPPQFLPGVAQEPSVEPALAGVR